MSVFSNNLKDLPINLSATIDHDRPGKFSQMKVREVDDGRVICSYKNGKRRMMLYSREAIL